jgi:hypothetical protein
VVVQMALAVMLIGAGLLLRASRAEQVRPGFNSEGVLTANLVILIRSARTATRRASTSACCPRRTIPGVSTAGLITGRRSATGGTASYQISQPGVDGQPGLHGHMRVVDEDYLKALQIPLLQGRGFATTDEATAPRSCRSTNTWRRSSVTEPDRQAHH